MGGNFVNHECMMTGVLGHLCALIVHSRKSTKTPIAPCSSLAHCFPCLFLFSDSDCHTSVLHIRPARWRYAELIHSNRQFGRFSAASEFKFINLALPGIHQQNSSAGCVSGSIRIHPCLIIESHIRTSVLCPRF